MVDTVKASDKAAEERSKQPQLADVLQVNLGIIDRAVSSKEARLLFGRVLRTTASVRGQFTASTLQRFISQTLPKTSSTRDFVLEHLQGGDAVRFAHAMCSTVDQSTRSSDARNVSNTMQDMEDVEAAVDQDLTVQNRPSQPEDELYCMFLLCQFLCDRKEWSKVLCPTWMCALTSI